MKVWIINPYGNIPGEGWRTYRTTLIADAFVEKGHEVVSWVSNIQHRSKEKRSESWKDVQVNPNYLIKIVPSTSYSTHISFDRIKYERTYAKNLRDYVKSEGHGARGKVQVDKKINAQEKLHLQSLTYDFNETGEPDLIILGEPALFISDIVLDIVKSKRCALIVDIIDLWPELFHILLPKKISFLGKLIFSPLYLKRWHLLKKANGIMAVSKDYLQLGNQINKAVPSAVVYWGVAKDAVRIEKHEEYESPVLQQLNKKENEIWVVYAGTLGDNYDIKTILACANLIEKRAKPIKIIMAGDGPLKTLITTTNQKSVNSLIYVGTLTINDLNLLYKQCDMALSSYITGSTVSMPIKAYDYLAAGLPLINSLGRDLGDFVIAKEIGIQYEPENANEMCQAILKLADNKELRLKMKQNALVLADEFDVIKQYDKAVVLAEKVITNRTNLNIED